MKKLFIIGILILGMGLPSQTFAVVQFCSTVVCGTDAIQPILPKGCIDPTFQCYGNSNNQVINCEACSHGYTRRLQSIEFPGCQGSFSYYECIADCSGCLDCTSDFGWSAHAAGYQKNVLRTCDCNTCKVSATNYRCAPGYYGTSYNGSTGCNACPGGGNSAAGITSVTGCYKFSGMTGSDASGAFEYTEDCYYTN